MYDKFVQLLQQFEVSTYRVSKITGIPQSLFTNWKKGKSKPKLDKLKKISDYFNVPLEYFVEDKEEKND